METIAPTTTLTSERPAVLDEKTLNAYRRLGYLLADLDPMNRIEPEAQPGLEGLGSATAAYARRIYCGTIGVEYMHIPDPSAGAGSRSAWKPSRRRPTGTRILDLLTPPRSSSSSSRPATSAPSASRSKGSRALIPLLDEMLEDAADHGAHQEVVGMSHRGRLNVLVNIVGSRPPRSSPSFEDVDPRSTFGGGDVKYHMGATGDFTDRNGQTGAASTWSRTRATWRPSIRWRSAACAPSRCASATTRATTRSSPC